MSPSRSAPPNFCAGYRPTSSSTSCSAVTHEVEVKSDEVQDAHEHMERANQVYSSFVPREFLTLLEHDNILDVQLDDQVQTEMCILFSDIISFTSLSEQLGPGDSFRFINAYLSSISPIIRMNFGFIDKYSGDSIMALFPTTADDAVEAAVGMQQAMAQFNEKFIAPGAPPVQIGVGVHSGELMLASSAKLNAWRQPSFPTRSTSPRGSSV